MGLERLICKVEDAFIDYCHCSSALAERLEDRGLSGLWDDAVEHAWHVGIRAAGQGFSYYLQVREAFAGLDYGGDRHG